MTDATRRATRTGGRDAIEGVIPGRYSLSVGNPDTPAPDGWKWTLLRDVARLESGHTPSRRKPEYWNGDIPWIGIRDATGNHGWTLMNTQQHTNQLGIDNSSARLLPANTVCLSRTASVGYVVVMGVPMATSQDFVNWVCSPEIDHRFLKYVLLAEHDTYLSFASGTTHQTIYYPEVKAFHVCLPPIEVQRQIADVLQSIDDLIENNRRRVEVLEGMARAIYREWFVHFRFPGHEDASFVDSDLGPIPEGWDVASLGSTGKWLSGGTPRTSVEEYWDGDIPWITSGTLTSVLLDRSERRVTPLGVENGTKVVPRDSLIFVVRGMSLVREFRVGIADVPVAFGQDCKAIIANDEFESLFVAFEVISRAEEIQGMHELAGHGTGKLSTDRLKALKIPKPPREMQERFVGTVQPLRESMTALRLAADHLESIRDGLLPKLVTGKIDLSNLDLDAVLEKAAV